MALDDPHARAVHGTPVTKATLEATNKAEPEAHEEGTDEEQRTTPPSIDVNDGGDGKYDVEHVLN